MALIKMSRALASAAGMDAGNRSTRAAGRFSWNEDDLEAARLELLRLWPPCPHGCDPENCLPCYEAGQAT